MEEELRTDGTNPLWTEMPKFGGGEVGHYVKVDYPTREEFDRLKEAVEILADYVNRGLPVGHEAKTWFAQKMNELLTGPTTTSTSGTT